MPLRTDSDRAEIIATAFDSLARLISFISHLDQSALAALSSQSNASNESQSSQAALQESLHDLLLQVKSGLDALSSIEVGVKDANKSLLDGVDLQLSRTQVMLAKKKISLERVLANVESNASKLSLLAVNAGIEAAHAGDAGGAFAVVAQEVKRLADQAILQSKQAADLIDISAIVAEMEITRDTTHEAAAQSRKSLDKAFKQVRSDLDRHEEHVGAIFRHAETISRATDDSIGRAQSRLEWSNARLADLAIICANADPSQITERLKSQLVADGIPMTPGYDRLGAIKQRGTLRVAIEPAFVGLSFRLNGQGDLQGLDADYARALAGHLGVSCEFIEAPWDILTEHLRFGTRPGNAAADIVLSALPPNAEYDGVAYSETYTYLHWVLARRTGDASINGLRDLDGKTLGIINDPGAFQVLEELGVRWPANSSLPGGKHQLKALVAYSDQSRIHDCLADGDVDAFGVDLPIYHWACSAAESPWHGKIEICSGNLPNVPYYYAVAVQEDASSYLLMTEINRFIANFKTTPERLQIEKRWQGTPVQHSLSFRDEPGNLSGESHLRELWNRSPLAARQQADSALVAGT